MDEVDGCSAGDRGGIGALVKVIEKCKQPIVCIANDHGSRKISALLSHCYDIKLVKPVQNEILGRMKYICSREQLNIGTKELEKIIQFSGNDLRQIINVL